MNRRLVLHATAETDIHETALWYLGQRPGLDDEFMAEVDAAIARALAHPRLYPRLRARPEVRFVLTRRFPYRVFYMVERDAIVVFRVRHLARDEGKFEG